MEESRLGVIDSLSAGLNLVTQRVWVITIPVVLDLWYWVGPRLSITPLLKQIGDVFVRSVQTEMPQAPVSGGTVASVLDAMGQQFDLFSLLSIGLLGVPSLMANRGSGDAGTLEVHNWLLFVGLVTLLFLLGLGIGCLYLTLIAQGMRDRPVKIRHMFREAGITWLRVVALGLLLLFGVVALLVPFSFLVGLLSLVSGAVASFLMGIVYIAIIWVGIYLYFAVDAIIVNGVGPVRAVWNSANIVARNFWSALGLIVLILVMSLGLSLVWERLAELHAVGTVVGIAGHAFVGSGLVAAGLLFYRDRYRHWQEQQPKTQ